MYSKFFDFDAPLFHHLHLREEDARRVGRKGKPEAYYYPPQLNNHPGQFPHTYFGFDPDVTKEEVKARLLDFEKRDIRITELSRAYRIELGTGWYTPPGVVHAPGSYLTYEPQWNSDVNSVYENIVAAEVYPYDFLVGELPRGQEARHRLRDKPDGLGEERRPAFTGSTTSAPPIVASSDDRHVEKWVVYSTGYIAAKELTVLPGKSYTAKDDAAYGCILTQGHGSVGAYDAEAAVMLRFGGSSADEFFVSEAAAGAGVSIVNRSKTEPLVMLKHFRPEREGPGPERVTPDIEARFGRGGPRACARAALFPEAYERGGRLWPETAGQARRVKAPNAPRRSRWRGVHRGAATP